MTKRQRIALLILIVVFHLVTMPWIMAGSVWANLRNLTVGLADGSSTGIEPGVTLARIIGLIIILFAIRVFTAPEKRRAKIISVNVDDNVMASDHKIIDGRPYVAIDRGVTLKLEFLD